MANCQQCGAPLAANTNQCIYCGTRNDVDLHAKFPYRSESTHSTRMCPSCTIPLTTIRSTHDEALFLEKCDHCLGLFFDRGELEYLLNQSVSHVHEINLKHINNINADRYKKPADFSYRKCPECAVLMNRINFGHRSAVVVDQCVIHGIWLDNGELTHLMEWKKAGGQLLDQQLEKHSKQQAASVRKSSPITSHSATEEFGSNIESNAVLDVMYVLISVIIRFFFGK